MRELQQRIVGGVRARTTRVVVCALLVLAAVTPVAWGRDPIVPLNEIHRGLHCTAATVIQGTDITSFDVDVLDVVAGLDGGGARILVHVSGPAVAGTGVASGFSGSPVYCPGASGAIGNAGAISATIGQFGNDVALVTPIEQMLGLDVVPPSGVRKAPRLLRAAKPLATPVVVAGLAPSLAQLVQRSAARHGRAVLAAPDGPLGTFAPQPLVPGASLAVSLASGDLSAAAVGTVTYRDGNGVYGFGHPLEGAGRRALLLQDAYVYTVVGNPLDLSAAGLPSSYKLAAPGHALGTLTSDQSAGVVGKLGALPPTIPLHVRARDLDRDRTTQLEIDLADETDVGTPDGPGFMPMLASLAAGQGVIVALDGAPAEQSGHMCLRVRVRELPGLLRFCNRYVASGIVGEGSPPALVTPMMDDITSALSAIDTARFAALHLKSISVSATLERGLRLATLEAIKGPHVVKPGQRVSLKLRVRLHRGPLRTISVATRIPRDARSGRRTLKVSGSPLEGDGGGDLLFDFFGGGEGGSSGKAESLREVRERFESTARYDGITARLGGSNWNLFRSEQVRIDGRASLDVRVVGGHGARSRGGGDDALPSLEELLDGLGD